MADTSGLGQLKHTVKEFLMLHDLPQTKYKKMYQIAINGLRELHLFHLHKVNTVKRTPSDLGIINYPSDYIKLVGIYFYGGNGELFPATEKRNIVNTKTLNDGVETNNSSVGEGVNIPTGEEYYFDYGTNGGKNDYYYYNDEQNRRFIVNGLPITTMFIKYVSSGVSLTDDPVYYPIEAKASLIAYMRWQNSISEKGGNKSYVPMYEQNYYREVRILRTLNLPTSDELAGMIYESITRTPRR